MQLTAERVIHVVVFILLLIGLCGVAAWGIYTYVVDTALKIASMALSWGVILLILYLGFKALKWDWWG